MAAPRAAPTERLWLTRQRRLLRATSGGLGYIGFVFRDASAVEAIVAGDLTASADVTRGFRALASLHESFRPKLEPVPRRLKPRAKLVERVFAEIDAAAVAFEGAVVAAFDVDRALAAAAHLESAARLIKLIDAMPSHAPTAKSRRATRTSRVV